MAKVIFLIETVEEITENDATGNPTRICLSEMVHTLVLGPLMPD